jgi:hypothetical protein
MPKQIDYYPAHLALTYLAKALRADRQRHGARGREAGGLRRDLPAVRAGAARRVRRSGSLPPAELARWRDF